MTTLFKKATINLPNGNKLTIEAPNNAPNNPYVQWIVLNGEAHSATDLTHENIIQGGILEFVMTDQPVRRPVADKDLPFSLSNE